MKESRIIPTRVGTSKLYIATQLHTQDHPHACGDKLGTAFFLTVSAGSSPRVWGQDPIVHSRNITCRIIPTRVGTSRLFKLALDTEKDHPHACGDKMYLHLAQNKQLGSSPRVWGQVASCHFYHLFYRIIPTRVGTRL